MPDARIEADGTWRLGFSSTRPYSSVWSSVTLLPWLEVSGRYNTIDAVPAFPTLPGNYKDKAFDAKVRLWEESQYLPAVSIGAQDYVGTHLFSAQYIALSKHFGRFDMTLGYGADRIDGAFGGVRYTPAAFPDWDFAVEYDANNYRNDFRADVSGADRREGGVTYAVGYRYGWLGSQLSYQHGQWSGNVYVAIPLMQHEFIPKIHEPRPYSQISERVSRSEWEANASNAIPLMRALDRQEFKDVRLRVNGDALEIALTHDRISLIGRAVGRAARTALHLGPNDIAVIRITYTVNGQPLLNYEFRDLHVLARYLGRQATKDELDASVVVTFASVELARQLRNDVELWIDEDEAPFEAHEVGGRFMALRQRMGSLAGFGLLPFNARVFFNDPGAPVRYDTFTALTYARRVGHGLFVNGSARLTLFENVSDIVSSSTSVLPHVRSDISEYRREGDRLRLESLLLNKYALLAERVYGRVSAGYYEEMYAGTGGQVLYLPRDANWAVDVAVDWLKQRAPGEAFGFRDYSVATGITSAHYRFPDYGVTTTARIGRFLAKDAGVRFELKRRFRSGVEIGAWYSWTDKDDITGPGTPEEPYRDKGVFAVIPLNSMLTKDTQERAGFTLADFTRDVGQMVVSPGDLYRLVERPLMLDSAEHGPFSDFAK